MGDAFSVWDEHKEFGLAPVVKLLGMKCGQAAPSDVLRDFGFFLLIVDPVLPRSATHFKRRLAELSDVMRATGPADPARPVRVPFDRSEAERSRRLHEDRIEVADEIYRALKEVRAQPG